MTARRLQLGAFDQPCAGWLNTDVTPHLMLARLPGAPWLARRLGRIDEHRHRQYRAGTFRALRRLDVSRRFPFPDGSFEAVYCSHLLEHLYPEVAARCTREVHRVLAPAGVFRVAVPDLDAMVARYDAANPDEFVAGFLQAASAADERSAARHRWHYNEQSLARLLRAAGFSEPSRCAYRQGRLPDVERIETREWSLFLEAVK
jgi:SAM-dependent methyltransferase